MNVNQIGKNQLEIRTNNKVLFQSYNTIVAAHIDHKTYVTDSFFSKTTSKHISQWLKNAGLSDVTYKPQSFFDSLMED